MNEMTLARKFQYAATYWDYGVTQHVYFRFTQPYLMSNSISMHKQRVLVSYLYIKCIDKNNIFRMQTQSWMDKAHTAQ